MKLSDFDYYFPRGLIAQYPCRKRGDSRLLVLDRTKKRISHQYFKDIVDYFSCGDCLVINNTMVLCARMMGGREKVHPHGGGGKQELFLLENLSKNVYRVLAKPARKLTVGAKIFFNNADVYASVLADQGIVKVVQFSGNGNVRDVWARLGQLPLPPYIKRKPEDLDQDRYQTVYASQGGATAAATAGLHFTRGLLDGIRAKGVNIVDLTLHINYGTFAPVKSDDIRKHKMHKEYFILPDETAEIVNLTRVKGKKVFAVGTTAVRVLETCAKKSASTPFLLEADRGWTDLFVYPPYRFKAVDCLLTNFHFPKSTLLMLVSAFAGRGTILKAYAEAIASKYRLFSYGDAMLIL